MKRATLCISLFLLAQYIFAQCPPNIDFEAGDFSHWDCLIGTTSASTGQNMIWLDPSQPVNGRHTIISDVNAKDPYGGFPMLCPYGGKYSVRLGDSLTGAHAEGLSYNFLVPPLADTFTLTYFYAVVFQNPNHPPEQQPRFFVTAYDVLTGDPINCASYNYIATGGIPGFQESDARAGVWFKSWTPSSIQVTGMANRNIRLEFKTADCTPGGHFGYAYVDVGAGCNNVLATAPYCIETNAVVLNAPYGFQDYIWYDNSYSNIVGTQQSVTLSPPPATNGNFHVDLIPYPGYGCRDTLEAIVKPVPVPDTPVAKTNYQYCQFDAADVLTATPQPNNQLLWYSTSSGGTGSGMAPTPSTYANGSFTYFVSQKILFGCESFRKPITINVNPVPEIRLDINDSCVFRTINYQAVDLSDMVTKWYWDFGNGPVEGVSFISKNYSKAGNYPVTLKALAANGCETSTTRPFVIFDNKAFAGRDTTVAINQPIQLNANGGPGNTYNWTPATGLDNPAIETPIATWNTDMTYYLDALTDKGCDSHSQILIKRFKGPALYIPTGFTPNADGLNEVLKVLPVGIKSFISFAVYNRYGQKVFSTTDFTKGWDGKINGQMVETGIFVAVAQAIDYYGNAMVEKVNVRLIR